MTGSTRTWSRSARSNRSVFWASTSLLASMLCTLAGVAEAQSNSQVNSGIQFDFPLPGARSLGLGGAFVAVADDATAAVANPAGLTVLLRPEISVEGRHWRYTSVTPLRGHAFGPPTNIGVDTIPGIVNGETAETTAGPSFLSAVFPKGRMAVGLYRHEQSRFRANITSEGPFITHPQFGEDRLRPFTGSNELDLVNYGLSVARRFGNGLSIGGGVAVSQFSLESQVNVAFRGPEIATVPVSERPRNTAPGQIYGPANLAESNSEFQIFEKGTDTGLSLVLGSVFRPVGAIWSIGGSVRINPTFNYDQTTFYGPGHPFFANRPVHSGQTGIFDVPDVYSVGAAVRPTDRFLLSGQYDRVQFSQLSRDLINVNGPGLANSNAAILGGLSFPDSDQGRFGAEYALVSGTRVASFRMGTAYVTPHDMQYKQVTNTRETQLEVLYPPSEGGQWHLTPGFGLAFEKFQVDAAFDYSERTQTASVSAVYRF